MQKGKQKKEKLLKTVKKNINDTMHINASVFLFIILLNKHAYISGYGATNYEATELDNFEKMKSCSVL